MSLLFTITIECDFCRSKIVCPDSKTTYRTYAIKEAKIMGWERNGTRFTCRQCILKIKTTMPSTVILNP